MTVTTHTPTASEQAPAVSHTCRLDPVQVEYLMKPIAVERVKVDPKGFRYVEQQDIRVWLNRVFGVGGWSVETLELACTLDANYTPEGKDRPRFNVAYRAQARLHIKAPCGHEIAYFDDGAFDAKTNQTSYGDAHDNAMKGALSGALKRCAVSLGDAFGLGLYYKDIKPGQSVVQNMIPYLTKKEIAA